MKLISLRIDNEVFDAVQHRAQTDNLSFSDTIRECIIRGINTPKQNSLPDHALQKTIAVHSLLTYCLVDEMIQTMDQGTALKQKAELKADQLADEIIASLASNETQ